MYCVGEYCEGQSQRVDFPSPSELVSNAMHLYGPPVQVADLSSDRPQLRLYPCPNFTCSGRIVKLMFIAPVETDSTVTVRWPEFGLWRKCNRSHGEGCDWMEVKRLPINSEPCLVYVNEYQTVGVYEIVFRSNISNNIVTFEHGNFLGVRRSTSNSSDYHRNIREMNVLYQTGGGYCDALALMSQYSDQHINCSNVISRDPIIPYVAVETGQMYIHVHTTSIVYYANPLYNTLLLLILFCDEYTNNYFYR